MPSLERTDKILLAVLLPITAVVLFLHVQAIQTSGIAQVPFFAAPPESRDAYPTVGGPRLEHGIDRTEVRLGDRLIRAGDLDLRGCGYICFDALVVEAAGAEAKTTLIFERDGVRHSTQLELLPYPKPWMRVPFLVSGVLVGLIVLLRAREFPARRAFFVSATMLAIAELHFFGGSRWQNYASLLAFNFGGSIAMVATLRWHIGFPPEVPASKRLPTWICWSGALFTLGRLNYMFDGPVPSSLVPRLVLGLDLLFLVSIVAILGWNTWHASAIGRRRSKWVVFGVYAAFIPTMFTLVPEILQWDGFEYFNALPIGFASGTFLHISILIAIIRYDLFDIDRVLSSFGAYTVAAAGLLILSFVGAPAIADSLSRMSGVDEQVTRLLLAATALAIIVPLGGLLRPRLERIFLPDRRRREEGFQQLYTDLSECTGLNETVGLLVDRLRILLSPLHAEARVRSGESFVALPDQPPASPLITTRSALVLGLEANPRPLNSRDGSLRRRLAQLPADERKSLEALGVTLVVPLRRGKDLVALFFLGAQRSGEAWTSADLTLLRGATEKASAELSRITESANLQQERERATQLDSLRAEANEANLAKSRFLAAASHDLRQPLHALGLFVGRLKHGVEKGDAGELINQIESSTDSLVDMFTSLLDLSRLDVGAIEPDLQSIALSPLIDRLATEMSLQADKKGLLFETDCDDVYVRSDPLLLSRIIRNLLVNAVHCTTSGSIRLSAKRPSAKRPSAKNDEIRPDHIDVSVCDTGPGIPLEMQQSVFREFIQGAEPGNGDGMGLGLSIVDRLARILNHPLSLDSTVGSGSEFRLRLPIVGPPETSAVTSPTLDPSAALRGRLVLVIDDDLAILNGMRTTLRGWGCSVLIAANLEDAIAGIEQRGMPDVILADLRLADGATGIDAIRQIRAKSDRTIAAAVLTGETSPAATRTIRSAGLIHLAKPLAPFALRAALTELLRID